MKSLLITVVLTTIAIFVWGINFPYKHDVTFEISGVELIKQPDQITCGPTSALMLLKIYGKDATLKNVSSKMYTEWIKYDKPIGMTSPDSIPPALAYFGIESRLLSGTLDRLRYFVCKKRPVLVLVRSGETTWHWVMVVGYDEKNIIVADPGRGQRILIKNETFETSWNFTTDFFGNSTSLYLNSLLRIAEVHPHTMIVPRLAIGKKQEGIMFTLVIWIVFGLIVGSLAKLFHPGEDPIGFLPTVGIGIAGSLIGGTIQWLLNMGGTFSPAGILWSVIGGVLFCYSYRRFKLKQFLQIQGRMPEYKKKD
jgi:uncharacterized membrane protein YeaQ/YmgE (transglycosylase-associated protein family)